MGKNGSFVSDGSFEEIVPSSGIPVKVTAFPASLWTRINLRAHDEYPDPDPPKKTIKVLNGTEEVDDINDPDYVKEKETAEHERGRILGEAIMDLCVHLDVDKYKVLIKRLEKHIGEKYPKDIDDRRIMFITEYVLKNSKDYEDVTWSSISQMMITDKEVADRLKFPEGDVARSTFTDLDASGSNAVQQLELEPEDAGA